MTTDNSELRDMVTVVAKDGQLSSINESTFDPVKHMLAQGSRIPAAAAVFVGATASSTLNSVAGDPKLADMPGLIPVAWNPPPGHLVQGMAAVPGSSNAMSAAENATQPAALAGDAAKANKDHPKAKTNETPVETGQLFTAKVKGGKFAVCTADGKILGKGEYDDPQQAIAAYQQPTNRRG